MENCAVVLSSSSSEGQKTMLGVIGPKRMNYEKVISVLDRVLQDLVNCSSESEGNG
jgi:heat-inducible transcriptional repressor